MESNKHATESDLSPSRKLIILSYLGTRKIMFKRALKGDMRYVISQDSIPVKRVEQFHSPICRLELLEISCPPSTKTHGMDVKVQSDGCIHDNAMVKYGGIWWNMVEFYMFLISYLFFSHIKHTHTHTKKKKEQLLVSTHFRPFPFEHIWAKWNLPQVMVVGKKTFSNKPPNLLEASSTNIWLKTIVSKQWSITCLPKARGRQTIVVNAWSFCWGVPGEQRREVG